MSVQQYNSGLDIKDSTITNFRESEARSKDSRGNTNMTSPVQRYNINTGGSPLDDEGFGIKMVESTIKPSGGNNPTYGLSESQRSSGSTSRGQSGYGTSIGQANSAYQTPSSSVSGGSSAYSSSISGAATGAPGTTSSNVYQPSTQRSTYQQGSQEQGSVPTYEASKATEQSGKSSGVYRADSGSYQGGAGSGYGVYQSRTG